MIEVELQVQIRRNGDPFLTSKRVKLLQEVQRCGSLRIAARGLHYSYQHAWEMVNEINRVASEPVVIKHRGGTGGGGATLSVHGKRILDEFRHVERLIKAFTKKLNTEINF